MRQRILLVWRTDRLRRLVTAEFKMLINEFKVMLLFSAGHFSFPLKILHDATHAPSFMIVFIHLLVYPFRPLEEFKIFKQGLFIKCIHVHVVANRKETLKALLRFLRLIATLAFMKLIEQELKYTHVEIKPENIDSGRFFTDHASLIPNLRIHIGSFDI